MAKILPFAVTDKRKIDKSYWTGPDTPTWPYVPSGYEAKTIQEFRLELERMEPKVPPAPAVEEAKTSPWAEWLNEYMEIHRTNPNGATLEIVGHLTVPPDTQPDSDKAAFVWLATRFLSLVDRVKKEGMPLTRLPEIVIGQVGNGYQAQVTLTLRVSE